MTRAFHATPWRGMWAVRRSGARRARKIGLSKLDAWREARRLARGEACSAYLHDHGGRVTSRVTYRASP